MIPDFLQSPETGAQISLLKTIIGLFVVLFAIFVGVDIRLDNEDEDP